ncbi:unnamed protein product, partial [Mesorhabditis belari]|uniref:Uncharacterized protein n=1 Tax=Mesorhabditis belari TaxID=2138241 RepID=A0AAF3J7E1_9BILA
MCSLWKREGIAAALSIKILFHQTRFRSVAYFFSDENGKIELGKDPVVFGMYNGIDRMGLFTSIYTHPAEKQTAKLVLSPLPNELKYSLTLHKREERKVLAETAIIRRILHENVQRVILKHQILEGTLYIPKVTGNQKLPCVLDLYGVAMGTREHRAAILAAHGYCVLALAIFGSGKLSKRHEDVTSEYLQSAVDYLVSLPFTQNHCAIVGTSFGGTLGYHLLFKKPEVFCALSINGQRGHYMVSQMNENGEKLPFTPVLPQNLPNIKFSKGFISYGEMYGSCELDDEHMLQFENLRSHQRLGYIAGGQDRAIDGLVQGREIEKILRDSGKISQYSLLELHDCGHIIDPPYLPLNDYLYQGGFEDLQLRTITFQVVIWHLVESRTRTD